MQKLHCIVHQEILMELCRLTKTEWPQLGFRSDSFVEVIERIEEEFQIDLLISIK